MSPSQTATAPKYKCLCEVPPGTGSFVFQAFSSTGQKGERIEPDPSEYLALSDQSGNTVKIEVNDVTWQLLGCFSPINNGDTLQISGVMNNFTVTRNGHPASSGDCPKG
jgi:hypothetical protein